jgi:hypothetical protein
MVFLEVIKSTDGRHIVFSMVRSHMLSDMICWKNKFEENVTIDNVEMLIALTVYDNLVLSYIILHTGVIEVL